MKYFYDANDERSKAYKDRVTVIQYAKNRSQTKPFKDVPFVVKNDDFEVECIVLNGMTFWPSPVER